MKFKIGDKVRRISHGWADMEVGDVGIIENIIFNLKGSPFGLKIYDEVGSYDINSFELYEDNFPELLKKAKLIRKLGDKII